MSEKHNRNIFQRIKASLVVLGIASVKLHFIKSPLAAIVIAIGLGSGCVGVKTCFGSSQSVVCCCVLFLTRILHSHLDWDIYTHL